MIKKDGGRYARDTENYSASPYYKQRMWLEIVDAAKIVIERGGADIRFVPPSEESERFFREHKEWQSTN